MGEWLKKWFLKYKTVITYLVILFISKLGIGFCVATYASFLLAHHLTLFQVNLVNAVFFFTMMICEVPTGVFADVYGRKTSVLCSCIFFTIGLIWYGCVHSMSGFMMAEVCIALGVTFSNGALQAWFVDTLKSTGFVKEKEDGSPDMPTWLFGIEYAIMHICGIAAGFVGGVLADKNLSYPWFAGALTMFMAGITIFFIMKEDRQHLIRHTFTESFNSARNRFISGWHHIRTNHILQFIFFVGMINMFVLQVPNMQWQPFFEPVYHSNTSRGIVFTWMALFLVTGSVSSMIVSKKIHNHRFVILLSQLSYGFCILMAPICVIFYGIHGMMLSLGFFLLHEIGRGFWIPVRDAYMHATIQSHERATLVSVTLVSQHFGGVCGLVLFGFFSDMVAMNTVWLAAGSILVINSCVLLVRPRV